MISDCVERIQNKCEQYWNEHNISDVEVHAILEFIHREAGQITRELYKPFMGDRYEAST